MSTPGSCSTGASSDERANLYQAATTAEKLRGGYYTPPELIRLILESLDLQPGDRVLDPACGDGAFLAEAGVYLARRYGLSGRRLAESLAGFEIHPEAAAAAEQRLRAIGATGNGGRGEGGGRVRVLDALELRSRAALLEACPELAGGRLVVVGNPPYVEAKRLPPAAKRRLRAAFPEAAAGAPDLYLYFLHLCLGWLGERDRLAFVLPNRALVNANARNLRERLLRERRLTGLDFASLARVFPDAAVYPVVLYAGGPGAGADPPERSPLRLARIERIGCGLRRVPLPSLPPAAFAATEGRAFFPPPESPELAALLARMLNSLRGGRLGEIAEIRWTVSFHRRGLRERYVLAERPAGPHGRPFLGGAGFCGNGEVRRYRLEWAGWWIDYDRDRLRAEGNPLPEPAIFDRPKVVICQNGRTLRAAYDDRGFVLKDTFLCTLPRPESDHPLARNLRALVGFLCSRAVHFYFAHVFHGGHASGGYLHFLRSFLVDLPLGEWDARQARAMEERVRCLEKERDPGAREALESEIEARVEAAFGLSDAERRAVAAWAASDPRWMARERVRHPLAPRRVALATRR